MSYSKTAKPPNKYDHFHNKTFIETFIPTFQSNYFTNVLRRGEKPYELPPSNGRFQVLTVRPIFGAKRNRSEESKPKRLWRPKPLPLKRLPELHKRKATYIPVDFDDIPSPTDCKERPIKVLCVKDGSAIDSDKFRFIEVDFTDYKLRFIGKKVPKKFDENQNELMHQGLEELFEKVAISLKPTRPFTHMFTLEGVEVPNLLRVSAETRVLLFSSTGIFKGLLIKA